MAMGESGGSDDQGLDALAERLSGRTTVVAGPSGVGKSTMINTLWLKHMQASAHAGTSAPCVDIFRLLAFYPSALTR